jgi:hypothetical protein
MLPTLIVPSAAASENVIFECALSSLQSEL